MRGNNKEGECCVIALGPSLLVVDLLVLKMVILGVTTAGMCWRSGHVERKFGRLQGHKSPQIECAVSLQWSLG